MRASLVVNCQSALTAAALRRCCQAWTWRSSVVLSPTRSGRSRPRALSSISAMLSQEPCLGVWSGAGPSQSWGSGGHRPWRVWVVGRQEFLPETGAERAVVEGAADLEQQIGPAPGPAHLLRLGHAAVDQEVGCALGQRRADPLPGPVPLGVVDQMSALAGQVAVQRVQGGPQLP